MAADDQEKTEKATPKRRQEARKKGQVITSRELTSALLILVGVLVFKGLGFNLLFGLKATMTRTFSSLSAAAMTQTDFSDLMRDGMMQLFMMGVPVVVLIGLVGALSVVMQHGILFTTDTIMPEWGRIDPLSGFKRLASLESIVNGLKTFFKFLAIGWVAYLVIARQIPSVLDMSRLSPGEMVNVTGELIATLVLKCGSVVAVIGLADFGFQWWENEKKLRMSKQEIKEETKQTEGSPQVKSRIRSLQREMAKKRMMADVPKADVVITNPTRLAVALKYEPEKMAAPKVVAKGAGFVAERIRELARAHGIPVVENKPVARTLFKTVKIGQQVPSVIYRAVAEILSYVYRLKGQGIHS